MPRRCELTGTTPQSGHNVSHSNRKTHRTFDVNLQNATFYSDALKHAVGLRVTTRAIRTVQKVGGLDAYLIKTADAKLPPEGLRLKHRVKKALRGKPAKPARSEA
jgi:large subunit ribosomal protein L28